MRNLLWLSLCGVILLMPLSAATIQYQVAPTLTPGVFEFTYFISGTFLQNQEVDIQFDPTMYTNLSNGQPAVSSDWDIMVFQPNVPPGTQGDYTAFALVNNPSLAGPFKVDATYTGSGTPGAQFFTIQYFGVDGNSSPTQVGFGNIAPFNADPVPEPTGFVLSAVALSVLGACKAVRHKNG
jgi:hypothetical protein